MAGLVQFNRFYMQRGIRTLGQMLTLRKNPVAEFFLPLDSTLHLAIRGVGDIGISESDELLLNFGTRIIVDFEFNYIGQPQGNFTKLPVLPLPLVNKFLQNNKRFRYRPRAGALANIPGIMQVVNYTAIDNSYRYTLKTTESWVRKVNFFDSVLNNVERELRKTKRNQFIYFETPSLLPAISRLQIAENEIRKLGHYLNVKNQTQMLFESDGAYLLLHLWLWVGENPLTSMFSRFTREDLERINIVTMVDGVYTVLNLDTVKQWIRDDENKKGTLAPATAQKLMLRHFMALQQLRSVSDDTLIVDRESVIDRLSESQVNGVERGDDQGAALYNDSEYLEKTTAKPHLEVNIDANRFEKGKTVNVDAKTKKVPETERPEDLDEEESFLFDQMEADLKQLEITNARNEVHALTSSEDVYTKYEPPEDQSPERILLEQADDLAAKGLLSSAEIRRIHAMATKYQRIKSPWDGDVNLSEFMKIPPEDLQISQENGLTSKKIKGVIDQSMMNWTLKDFDSKYIKKVMNRDMTNALIHMQKGGFALTDLSMSRHDDILGSSITLSVQVTPPTGEPTTFKVRYPVVNEDGIFKANGVNYVLKKQRVDAPIRKVSPTQVALTSYMSKIFVNRTERSAFNYAKWLCSQINLAALDKNHPLGDVHRSNVHVIDKKLPLSYTSIAQEISGFSIADAKFSFDYNRIDNLFPDTALQRINRSKFVPIGYKTDATFAMDADDVVHVFEEGGARRIGRISELLGLSQSSEPVPYAEAEILGEKIPVGILLAYIIGLGRLLKTSGCHYKRVKRANIELQDDEFCVIFEDEALIFKRSDSKAALLFNGFNRIKNTVRRISVYSLDKREGYPTLFTALGAPGGHLKQYPYVFNAWVDHITRDLLLDMKEPTDLFMLFLSAVKKLEDDSYEDPNGVTGAVLRGYQRFTGLMYDELFKAMRKYHSAPHSRSAKIDINPNAVWFAITQDQTVAPIEESNPIHSIKEKDIVVFRGRGGRSGDTMTAKHRQMVDDSIGIISEANVDNGQTGTIAYLTADPSVANMRGMFKPLTDIKNAPRAKLQSTAMMLSPGSDTDDAKRVTFTSVMFTSTTFLYNATPNRVLTGAERTIAFRASNKWAKKAKMDGRVTSIKNDVMTVEYKDGSRESISIGRQFGTWSGATIPHDNKTSLKAGDTFGADDIIVYNSHYFQPDSANKGHVIFKRGVRGTMLMWETLETLEDGDSISRKFAQRLGTGSTERRYVKVDAKYDYEQLVKVGDHVHPETILCTLRPPLDGISASYDKAAMDALDSLNRDAPKAKHSGVIDRVEVLYTGEIDNMSESLQEVVSRYDNELYRKNRELNIPVKSAQVPASYAINNTDIGPDQVVLVFYITEELGAGVGDKLVFGNQLKSIISDVLETPYVAEDGTEIDITFGRQSVANRIVNSADLIGTTNTVVSLIEKEVIEAYLNKDSTT